MTIGQCIVEAATWWGSTGIQLIAGHTYRFEAAGRWFDAGISAGPEGYDIKDELPAWKRPLFRMAAPLRPLDTGDRWYMLLGRLGEHGRPFVIGGGGPPRRVAESEVLYATVNDLRWAYRNNTGCISLTVLDLG